MRKIVLIAANAKYSHSALAVWLLKAAVAQYGEGEYDINVIEATIAQNAEGIADMLGVDTFVVGLSVYIWNARFMLELLRILKIRLPEVFVVLGGPEAANNTEFWLENGADFVIRGEGERSFPLLLDELGKDTYDLNRVSGLSYRHGEGLRHNDILNYSTGVIMEDINPYDVEYLENLGSRMPYVETSRGCPFRCEFCLSWDEELRFLPLDEAMRRLDVMAAHDVSTVKLVDRTFNANRARAYELFSYVMDLDTKACFHFEVAADLFDEETLLLLQDAPPGRIQMEIGLQSFYEPTLEAVARKTDLVKVEQNILKLLEKGNIHIHTDLIAGLPFETLCDFRRSFNRAYALGAHHLQLGFLKLLHGSALRRKADELGILYSVEPPYEILESKWLSREDIRVLKNVENALDRTYNKGRFAETIGYVMEASGLESFDFFAGLGEYAHNPGMDLEAYCRLIFAYCSGIQGVSETYLRDVMVRDWLRRSGGSNLPKFLRLQGFGLPELRKSGEKLLGRVLRRGDAALLWNGGGVVVDRLQRNPVTGSYRLLELDVEKPAGGRVDSLC